KPDNILITTSGVAKLSDLGLAKRTDETSHLTAARQGFGTPYYMPFEQAMNAKYADGRSDIYALGATLYHLVTGEVPFPGINHLEIVEKKDIGDFPPARTHNAEVPAVLDGILTRMLARDPADRYQTVSELIVDLDRSGLAAAVPSFIDPDKAMQDPVVRSRLTAPAQATAPDLRVPAGAGGGGPVAIRRPGAGAAAGAVAVVARGGGAGRRRDPVAAWRAAGQMAARSVTRLPREKMMRARSAHKPEAPVLKLRSGRW